MALEVVKIPDIQDSQVRLVYEENLELVSQCAGKPPAAVCCFCIARLCAACCGGKAVIVRFRLGMRRRTGGGCRLTGEIRCGQTPSEEVVAKHRNISCRLRLYKTEMRCVRKLQCAEMRARLVLSESFRSAPVQPEYCGAVQGQRALPSLLTQIKHHGTPA